MWKCRNCEAVKKNDPKDDLYCSGKCRAIAGDPPLPKGDEPAAVVERVASLEDYKKHPKDYRRRLEPEKLNWGPGLLNPEGIKQCGMRANRKPLPGDWDYEDE